MLVSVLAALSVGGCALFGFNRGQSPSAGVRDDIVVHTWRTLTRPPQEAWSGQRTALYTYVLIGDVGGNEGGAGGSSAAQDARKALEELLKEIQSGQTADSITDRELLARVNQFCVPAHGYSAGRLTLDQYDFELASSYLNRIRFVTLPRDMADRFNDVGPFFIGTRKPLSEIVTRSADGTLTIDSQSPLLVMDLSGRHRGSMPEYVLAYKRAVRNIDPGRSALLQPLRPFIASEVLKLNAALPFVAEAYAGTQKRFTAVAAPE